MCGSDVTVFVLGKRAIFHIWMYVFLLDMLHILPFGKVMKCKWF